MRGAARIGAGLALGACLGQAASCTTPAFTCQSDEACAGLAEGRCEPSGYCSVPDPACPGSGRRYAPHSGDRSEQCVEDGPAGGSTTTADTSDATTEARPSTTSGGTTENPGNTTLLLDDEGSSGPFGGSSSSGSESTGDEPPALGCPGPAFIEEPFAALPLDPELWYPYEDPGVSPEVIDGQLRLVATESMLAYTGFITLDPLPPMSHAGVELLAVPEADAPAETYVALTAADASYGFTVFDGALHTYFNDGTFVDRSSRPYDPADHRWLRLKLDQAQGTIEWQLSVDAVQWLAVDEETTLDAAFPPELAEFEYGAGTWNGPTTADPLGAFGHAFVCDE